MREYGWTPQELDAVPLPRVFALLACIQMEQKVLSRRSGLKDGSD